MALLIGNTHTHTHITWVYKLRKYMFKSQPCTARVDDIKTELQFVGKYWRLSGRPTVCLLIREEHMRDPQFKEMLDLLAMLKKGYCDGMKVRIGRLQNLISSSCTEHLDFMSLSDLPESCETHFTQIHHEYIGYQSLTDVPKAQSYKEEKVMCSVRYRFMEFYSIICWACGSGCASTISLPLSQLLFIVAFHLDTPLYVCPSIPHSNHCLCPANRSPEIDF